MKSIVISTVFRVLVSVSFLSFSVSSVTYLEQIAQTGLFRMSTPEILAVSFTSVLLVYFGTLIYFKRFSAAAAIMGGLLMIGSLFWYRRLGADLGLWEWQLVVTLFVAIPVIARDTAATWVKANSPLNTSALGKRASLAYIADHDKSDPHHRRRNGRVRSRLAGGQPRNSRGYSRNAPAGGHLRAPDWQPRGNGLFQFLPFRR